MITQFVLHVVKKKILNARKLGINTRPCELCVYQDIDKYERAYLDNTMTKRQIFAELTKEFPDLNNYQWYNHMRNHVKPLVLAHANELAPELASDLVDMVGEMAGVIHRIKDKVEAYGEDIAPDTDPAKVKAWIAMESELGRMIERLGRISGDLKGVTKVQNQNITVNFNNMVEQIMQDVCPNCKVKLAKTLDLTKSNEVVP